MSLLNVDPCPQPAWVGTVCLAVLCLAIVYLAYRVAIADLRADHDQKGRRAKP